MKLLPSEDLQTLLKLPGEHVPTNSQLQFSIQPETQLSKPEIRTGNISKIVLSRNHFSVISLFVQKPELKTGRPQKRSLISKQIHSKSLLRDSYDLYFPVL